MLKNSGKMIEVTRIIRDDRGQLWTVTYHDTRQGAKRAHERVEVRREKYDPYGKAFGR